MDLVQDVTADCSVVASLCASSSQTRRGISQVCYQHARECVYQMENPHKKLANTDFGPQLIRSIQLYPYDDETHLPLISAPGKYIFRMHFNGCYRKVIIDDFLPSSKTSRSLHVIDRNNPTAFWAALVEKAYLKVRGGYDFPGSNSGTDIWVLTGWIPEQVFLHHDELSPDELWDRLFSFFRSEDVLLTIGTGKLTGNEENELGLIGLHDYAVLDMKINGGVHQFLIKNPWASGTVWKGFGQAGFEDVTDETSSELGSSHSFVSAPGTFWMDCDKVFQHFENLYLNWNPKLFKYRQDTHFQWNLASQSSVSGCFAQSPQFSISSKAGGMVWLLLGKHFKTGDYPRSEGQLLDVSSAFEEPGYISIYVFNNGGRRVYLSEGASHRGPYVDSPNTLARLEMAPGATYTAVISEQSLPRSLHSFSLSAFSMSPLTISPAKENYPHVRKFHAAWTASTAGGNADSERYPENPQFQLQVPERCDINVLLESENADLATHVKVLWSKGNRVASARSRDVVADSGDYRRGFALAQKKDVEKGLYTLICSTFIPDQLGKFSLLISATKPCTAKPLPAEGAGRLVMNSDLGTLPPGTDRILASLTVPRLTRAKVICRRRGSSIESRTVAPSPILLTLELGQGPYKEILAASGDGDFSDAVSGARIDSVDLHPKLEHRGGIWLVVERIGSPGGRVKDQVEVEILSEERVQIGSWVIGDS